MIFDFDFGFSIFRNCLFSAVLKRAIAVSEFFINGLFSIFRKTHTK